MQLFKWRSPKGPLVEENRSAPRFDASDIPQLRIISDSGAPEAKLINISRRGALIESREHLLPGDSIYLQLAIDENLYYVRGQIINHRNSSMNGGISKIAIAFDEEFTSLPPSDDLLEDEDFLK
jgi:hypothetical protein